METERMRLNHWSLSQKLPQCQREDGPTAIPAPRGLVVQKLWDPDFHCEQGGALTDAKEDQGGVVNLLGTMSATPSGSVEPADPKGLSPAWGPQVPPDAVCPQGLHVSLVGHMANHWSHTQTAYRTWKVAMERLYEALGASPLLCSFVGVQAPPCRFS